ncbi:restriction endonuclease subunit S [Bifidobacterium longum]|uniref:restriction endonuclease subunit S n=2 Tax=Bifidobacterium longum TaxID=216816 RepID=UPI002B4B96BF|nr:restriction endonuclease subunit S [Bifidobacterium longum]
MNLAIRENAKHRNEKLVISGNCHCPPSFRYSRLSMIRQTSRKYASAWEQRKFSEIVDVCSGRDYKHLDEGPIPVYGTGGYMTSVSEALSHNRDAIGIGRKGTIDKPYLLKAPFWTVDTLFYAIPKSDINLEFALCSFLNVDWKSKDESTGLPSLSKESINETVLSVPNVVEQNHLGNFFADLDRLITLHQRKRLSIRQRSPVWS